MKLKLISWQRFTIDEELFKNLGDYCRQLTLLKIKVIPSLWDNILFLDFSGEYDTEICGHRSNWFIFPSGIRCGASVSQRAQELELSILFNKTPETPELISHKKEPINETT